MLKRLHQYCIEILTALDADTAANDPRCRKQGRAESEPDRWLPFAFLHLGCLSVLLTGTSVASVSVAVALYCVRMFVITAFYHRYFSHRTFKTSRFIQTVFAIIGLSSVQRGPLWWAAHHRTHHLYSDTEKDVHSPIARSFIWSHVGWITSSMNMPTDYSKVRDFESYPELRWLNRYDWLGPALLIVCLYQLGEHLPAHFGTSGAQMVAWGFFVSTTVLFHATASINSLSHVVGFKSFDTEDNSRNNPILALITFGEGWHNNHHRFSHSARQGFLWWQLDLSYYILVVMSALGLVWDLKPVPESVYAELYGKGVKSDRAVRSRSR